VVPYFEGKYNTQKCIMKIKASFHAFILYGFMQTIMSLQECPLQASSVLWCRGLHQLQPHTEVSVSVWNVVVVCYQTSVHLYWCVWVSLGSSSHFPSTCLTSQLGTTAVALYPGLLKRQMLPGYEATAAVLNLHSDSGVVMQFDPNYSLYLCLFASKWLHSGKGQRTICCSRHRHFFSALHIQWYNISWNGELT